MKKVLIVLIMILMGCSSLPLMDESKLNNPPKLGMAREEVIALWGSPATAIKEFETDYSLSSKGEIIERDRWTYHYKNGYCFVNFKNGKLWELKCSGGVGTGVVPMRPGIDICIH